MGAQPRRPGPRTLRALCKGLGEAALAAVAVDSASTELRVRSIAVRVLPVVVSMVVVSLTRVKLQLTHLLRVSMPSRSTDAR